MCGIVAAAGANDIVPVLLEGLRKLEYRGYDSAGLAVCNIGEQATKGLVRLRSVSRVDALAKQATEVRGVTGIAHTRWATHGVPNEKNAHPHISEGLAVVHNGIIENHEALRHELEVEAGFSFSSDTDTETIAHLIQLNLRTTPDLFQAVQLATQRLVGAYAIAVIDERYPERVVVARAGSPLLIGIGENPKPGEAPGYYAASDAAALLQVTRRIIYLESGDIAELTADSLRICSADNVPVERPEQYSQLSAESVDLGSYSHYMQKEIFEQPGALSNTLEMLGNSKNLQIEVFGADAQEILSGVHSVLILACGTSYYAGMSARYWIESIADLPCAVEVASEYRYRKPAFRADQLVVVISQSGETADTLAALEYAKSNGQSKTLAICNVPESSIMRECRLRFATRAGPEIGVASTKAFTTQLSALFLLTVVLAKQNDRLDKTVEKAYLNELRHLPAAVRSVLDLEPQIKELASQFSDKQHTLFLGRGTHYPIALEGALKLKEISYIHAEAYPAGELKHGPLALVDSDMPVVAVAPNDQLLGKLKSNLSEVKARGGKLYVFSDQDSEISLDEDVYVLRLPEHYGVLSPILHVIPLQLLAYHVALVKGTDVDKPRNLAKSVTVE